MDIPDGGKTNTTHWSMILSAADPASPDHQAALADLCQAYWYPVYSLVRRRGIARSEAEELTQEFFLRVLEKNYLQAADPQKGRFRTFLLVCVKRFLANEWDRRHAQKRGGGKSPLSLDFQAAEDRCRIEPADTLTPDQVFDRRWALTLLERVLESLGAEMSATGKQSQFETLKVYLTGEEHGPPYSQTADELQMTVGAAKVAVHRLRRRFGDLVRAEVARTVASAEDVDEEVRSLLAILCT
ncbi:MAG: RNA polymerase sigma factor [Planctomycetes bacterium ADurb.Bin126]|nr:MAG: RNA polymerase sigma factor [Planctomycetes bacterium ADurb.Bin126]HOD82268.1 sigma-70 family RNA polymerase sigma factor [Phycisphaerae bacterium]HQL72919.1 sigma-70 family RNA polymerase sigma factor [Phycisphaerae bacterium]